MIDGVRNVAAKALRRLQSAHKPIVRRMRRSARAREQADRVAAAAAVEREIAAVAASGRPIVAGPWLAEVGYEALYWLPFLRWFSDAHRVSAERITVVSRGGVEWWYRDIAARYVDLFDTFTPAELAAGNDERQQREEGGGRKQSASGAFDDRIVTRIRSQLPENAAILHPSLMFRLFRDVWHGGLPLDFFWAHADYARLEPPPRPNIPGLPSEYVAMKFYTGAALPDAPDNREWLRTLVLRTAEVTPVVLLDTGLAVDDHQDYAFRGIPNVINTQPWMTPRTNLGLQTALIAHARSFVGTCGGLVWLAPFLGVPTVGVYADDRQLAPHLLTARHAGRRAGAADFSLLDLRALAHLGMIPSQTMPSDAG